MISGHPSLSTSATCISVVQLPLAKMVCLVHVADPSPPGFSYQYMPSPAELATTTSSRPSLLMSPRALEWIFARGDLSITRSVNGTFIVEAWPSSCEANHASPIEIETMVFIAVRLVVIVLSYIPRFRALVDRIDRLGVFGNGKSRTRLRSRQSNQPVD
jgi:hypothetical protein